MLVVLASPLLAGVPIPVGTEVRILLHQLSFGLLFPQPCPSGTSPLQCTAWTEILWYAVLPEVLLALLVGAALGLSGAALQGTFRNPLADPYLLGISSGGTLGAAFLFIFRLGVAQANLVLPLLAFIGSLGTGVVILLASRYLGGSVETLLLVGVALANVLSAILSVVLLFNPVGSIQVSFWLLGGLGGATWDRDGLVLGGLLMAGAPLLLLGRELNLLQLGGDVAQSLGVDARRVRNRLLLLASVATSIAVAFTGIIGFVGLISPHVVRRVWSSDYRAVLPGSALVGAAFLLLAHDLSVVAVPTVVLPVGLFTAFVGAPFFFLLLFRHRRGVYMGGGA
ncbi:MAG: iron ABC transporter permease [Thermoplasmata archaeon]|nr:iron ABC transporter permease [Thermoplasmata archaeon]MCI4337753.1 iron ABC transporter permease [Thermoplasmata archaeon]MCI4341308.1 iron ABC transporter permease [Thermoplasmata archaeon]